MATVAKSIIYAWPSPLTSSTGTIADYSTASFGSKTLYFPETSSRVFKSVYAEISYHDNSIAVGGTITKIQVELRISGSVNNSVYNSNYTTAGDSTGENISFIGGPFDFTSFFNTYVPSNSSSINIQAFSYTNDDTGVSNIMLNPTFKLYCTYEHDNIDTTYIKTVIIPLESPTTGLSTVAPGTIGNQQIPRLLDFNFIDTSLVNTTSGNSLQTNVTSSYLVTNSGSYRIVLNTGFGDEPPTYISSSVYNSSSNELLYSAVSSGPSLEFDQYVFISSSSLPTKFRFEVTGNGDYSGFSAQIFLSQSVLFKGFLPESNVNIRDYFVEIEGNETGGGSTDIQLTGSIISSSSNFRTTFFPIERALSSDTYDRLIWSIPTSSLPNISQSHNFGLQTNITANNAFRHVPVNLYVTYEYNKATTTQVNNTILLGWNINSPLNLGTGGFVNISNVAQNTFVIPENNPILQQSALRIQWADTSVVGTLFIRVGENQSTSTDYTDGGSTICGMKSLQHRFDISASNTFASQSGVVLQKGINTIPSSVYASSAVTPITNTNGYFIINYKSDIHPIKGVDGCTRYYYFNNLSWPTLEQNSPTFYTSSFNHNLINSSSLYVVDILHNYISYERNATTLLNIGVQYTGSEAVNITSVYPKETTWRDTITSDAEVGSFITTFPISNIFKKYITSPQTNLMDPFVSRKYVNLYNSPTTTTQYTLFGSTNILVAHSYTFDFTGSIYNYTGDGSGIPITIYQSGSIDSILKLISTPEGKFSGTWFDDLTPIFASIDYGDKFGKSKLAIVTGSFDVYLTPFEYGYSNI
jgi:hypothetical protein